MRLRTSSLPPVMPMAISCNSITKWLFDWRRDAPYALLVAGIVIGALQQESANECAVKALAGNRAAIYAAIVSFFGAMTGAALTTVAIVLTWVDRKKFELLRQTIPYPQIWQILFSTIKWLCLVNVCAIVALVVDRDGDPANWARHITMAVCLICTARIFRSIWLLRHLVGVFASPN